MYRELYYLVGGVHREQIRCIWVYFLCQYSLKDERAVKNTKAYIELESEIHNYFIAIRIHIDVITGHIATAKVK